MAHLMFPQASPRPRRVCTASLICLTAVSRVWLWVLGFSCAAILVASLATVADVPQVLWATGVRLPVKRLTRPSWISWTSGGHTRKAVPWLRQLPLQHPKPIVRRQLQFDPLHVPPLVGRALGHATNQDRIDQLHFAPTVKAFRLPFVASSIFVLLCFWGYAAFRGMCKMPHFWRRWRRWNPKLETAWCALAIGPADSMILQQGLQRFFGHKDFRGGQERIIERIMNWEDVLVIMPTGAGKSLCYQLPALLRPGYCIVVTPLIALMKDQVDALQARNIAAFYTNSSQSQREFNSILDIVRQGRLKLLYIAPERLKNAEVLAVLRERPPSAIFVDEAHCVSQWGHTFRPWYGQLGKIFARLPFRVQICAFTATATPLVQGDIIRVLGRPDMQVTITDFARPNLAYRVEMLPSVGAVERRVVAIVRSSGPQTTIIYTATTKSADRIAKDLACLRYHGDMGNTERKAVQDEFIRQPCPVIVATNAFGMGIDRPDVRPEAYYQESGRAGRDGDPAECVLLFHESHRNIHEFFLECSYPPQPVMEAVWRALDMLRAEALSAASPPAHNPPAPPPSPRLELNLTKFARRIPECQTAAQLGAAIKFYEGKGHLTRGQTAQNHGWLQSPRPVPDLERAVQGAVTQRATLVQSLIARYGAQLEAGVRATYWQLGRLSGLQEDQLKRALADLRREGLIQWHPPETGRPVTLLVPGSEPPLIDYQEQQQLKQAEQGKLDSMFKYPGHPECRQRYFLEYFGQDPGPWTCGACDRCRSPAPAPRSVSLDFERWTALQAAEELEGRFGRQKVAQVLSGSQAQGMEEHMDLDSYAALGHLSQRAVLELVDDLMSDGLLERIGDQYPCVDLTAAGLEAVQQPRPPRAAAKRPRQTRSPSQSARRASSAPPTSGVPLDKRDLLQRLRDVRRDVAAARGLEPYKVCRDVLLEQLAELAPRSADDVGELKGLGPKTRQKVLPKLLKEVELWREQGGH